MNRLFGLFASLVFVAGCGGAPGTGTPFPFQDDAGTGGQSDGPGMAPAPDLAQSGSSDGTPTRNACTSSFGNALTVAHGRLDGFLVATVPVGQRSCSGDSHHVHLQIKMQGAIYDVAVTMQDNNGGDVFFTERDIALPDGAWSEGWHTADGLDYVALGLHAADFSAMPEAALAQKVTSELQTANHISVFATGYGPGGAHDVHRKSAGQDGAIVINPLSSPAHALLFHFATQTF